MAELVYRHWGDDLDPATTVCVDGLAPCRLQLSHWPGNATPRELKHDLSTGICLNLARSENRSELLRGITTVSNTHWDTDGLCSVFATLEPGLAVVRADLLLAAALAGDMSVFTTPEGVKIDLTLTQLTKHPDSPVASERFEGERERRQAQYDYALEMLPSLLANPDLHIDWVASDYWTIQRDLRALREDEAEVEVLDSLDLATIRADRAFHQTAVNTICDCDRILTLVEVDGGVLAELRLTTLSWFDLFSRPAGPRPGWGPLLEHLTSLTGGDKGSWIADPLTDPTPTLRYVDDDGRPVACGCHSSTIEEAVKAFYAGFPRLEAGF